MSTAQDNDWLCKDDLLNAATTRYEVSQCLTAIAAPNLHPSTIEPLPLKELSQ
jgi:hypothetical protein